MESGETKTARGYGKPPWIFRGSALYQLHLVKAETARALIPKEFRLVEAFGYTLGGFFLASYDDSPAGVFDELVVIAGTVWNPPTSCAWAAKVLVNSDEACKHGRKAVGLPSQLAKFSKRLIPTSAPQQHLEAENRFLSILGIGSSSSSSIMEVSVSEINSNPEAAPCQINLTSSAPAESASNWQGPSVKMWLPSFSGRTDYNPNLLGYSCQIECRIRAVSPVKVTKFAPLIEDAERREYDTNGSSSDIVESTQALIENNRNPSLSVLLSKPVLTLQFSCLRMQVEAPVVISHGLKSLPGSS